MNGKSEKIIFRFKNLFFNLFLLTKQLKKHGQTLSKPPNNSKNLKMS
jgi:hypothetical protein